MYPYLTLCWPHLPRVIWDGPECPLVPLLPDLPAGWHCFFVVAGLAQRETLGTEPSASDPCAGLEWILSRCLLRDEETVIDRDSDPHIGEVRVMCSSLSLPQWLHLSRAKHQRPCREPQGPVHSGPRPDPIACLLFLGLAPITSVCFSPIKHTRLLSGTYLSQTTRLLFTLASAWLPAHFSGAPLNGLAHLKHLSTGVCPHPLPFFLTLTTL